ncbi:MAG: hypothetical protein AAGH64_02255 [Planctomycetota bacterium]
MIRTLAAAVLLTTASASHAQTLPVLLEIDVSDPSAVLISATGAAPALDETLSVVSGTTLVDLFAGDFAIGLVTPDTTGTFAAPGMLGAYNRIANDFGGGNVDANDLNLWASGVGGEQAWTTDQPAFTGSWTLDLTGASFPDAGTLGEVCSDDAPNAEDPSGVVLGSFVVVPATGAGPVFALGLLDRRRRR